MRFSYGCQLFLSGSMRSVNYWTAQYRMVRCAVWKGRVSLPYPILFTDKICRAIN